MTGAVIITAVSCAEGRLFLDGVGSRVMACASGCSWPATSARAVSVPIVEAPSRASPSMSPISSDAIVRELLAEAEVYETPCGAGSMVWRRWGQGAPIVLLHGGSGSWRHWVRNIPVLKEHYELWVADLPGLGDSAMPDAPLTPQTCGQVVADGIRRLVPAARRPRLVCFSFGGHVGTHAAIALGDHLSAMIVSGCSALGLRKVQLDFPKERASMSEAERLGVHRRVLEILMISDPARIDDFAVRLQAENVGLARFRSRAFALTDDIKQSLAHVKIPLAAIWGGSDVLAIPNVEAVFDALRLHHPELVTRVVADAGHWVMFEQADAYNAALLELLGEVW